MGSESSDSNSSKSDSDSSSNSGNKNCEFETINYLKENENTIINRVWIVKKSITLNYRHIKVLPITLLVLKCSTIFWITLNWSNQSRMYLK